MPKQRTRLFNRAVVELPYGCGLRTSELCQLKLEDLDFKEQTVTIRKGKGGKPRVVPIGQYATHYLSSATWITGESSY